MNRTYQGMILGGVIAINWAYIAGEKQIENIDRKRKQVKKIFNVPWSHVIPVSATERYELTTLVHHMVRVLPDETKISIVREAVPDTVSVEAAAEAKRGVLRSVIDYAKKIVPAALTAIVVKVLERSVERLLNRFMGPAKGAQDRAGRWHN